MYNSWEPGSRCVVASRIKNSVRYYSIYCNIQFYLQYCTVSFPWVQQKKTKHSFSCWVFSNHGHSHGLVPQQSVLLDFMSPSEDSDSHQHTNHLASLKSSSLYICRYKLWHANHCFGWKTKEKYCLLAVITEIGGNCSFYSASKSTEVSKPPVLPHLQWKHPPPQAAFLIPHLFCSATACWI